MVKTIPFLIPTLCILVVLPLSSCFGKRKLVKSVLSDQDSIVIEMGYLRGKYVYVGIRNDKLINNLLIDTTSIDISVVEGRNGLFIFSAERNHSKSAIVIIKPNSYIYFKKEIPGNFNQIDLRLLMGETNGKDIYNEFDGDSALNLASLKYYELSLLEKKDIENIGK